MIYLRIVLAWALFLGGGAPSFANFAMSPSGSTTAFAIDASNQGTSLCAAASTECGAVVPINTAGSPLFTSANPGSVGAAASAFADGWNITEGAKADTACANSSSTCSLSASLKGILGAVQGAIPSGTAMIGYVGLQANTTGGCTPTHYLSAAGTNSTSVKASAGTVCSITIIQNTTTAADFRFYDSASAPTCSSATGAVANYGVQANTTSAGLSPNLGPFGLLFANGIGFCLTAYDGTDTNNSNATTGLQIDIAYK